MIWPRSWGRGAEGRAGPVEAGKILAAAAPKAAWRGAVRGCGVGQFRAPLLPASPGGRLAQVIVPGKLAWSKSASLPSPCEKLGRWRKMLLQNERILAKQCKSAEQRYSVSQVSLQITQAISFHGLAFPPSYHDLSDQKSSPMFPWCYILCVVPEGDLHKLFH